MLRASSSRLLRAVAAAILFAIPLLGGCATIRETYYIGVVDVPPQEAASGDSSAQRRAASQLPIQFYRFDLTAESGLGSSRYLSGWYTPEVLDRLVGEFVSQEEATAKEADPPGKQTARRYFIAGPEGHFQLTDDVRLAIFYTSSPEELTSAIRSLAQSTTLVEIAKRFARQDGAAKEKEGGALAVLREKVLADLLEAVRKGGQQ